MKINKIDLMPSIRELPVLLQIKQKGEWVLPTRNDGYIIKPQKTDIETKAEHLNLEEIKYLLLMMLKGDPNFIEELVNVKNNSRFINVAA